ncbi:MAG: hypothetical protein ABR497_11680 [Kiritimatiellia bacterium]
MSLIQEALRRQQAEAEGNPAPNDGLEGGAAQPPAVAPDNPPPATVEPSVPLDKKSGPARPWLSMLGVVLLAGLILAVAAGLFILARRNLAGGSSGESAGRPAAETASARRFRIVDTEAPARAAKVAAAVAERAAEADLEQQPDEPPPPELEQKEAEPVTEAPPPPLATKTEPAPPPSPATVEVKPSPSHRRSRNAGRF